MASPFRIFRKYQKAFLAIAAVLAMVIFVFADLLTSAVFSSRGEGKRRGMTVASWDGGSMTGHEMESLTQRRTWISNFLARLQQTGAQKVRDSGGTPMQPQVPNLILSQNLNMLQVSGGCINTRILSQLAKDAGISISNGQINDYLEALSFGQLSDGQIINLLTRGNKTNQQQQVEQLFAGLRELLLGNTYITSYYSALECVTPEERWQDWRRINERISVEATILPATQFVSKVPEPTELELRQFYDEYKNQVDNTNQWVSGRALPSPDPGFKVPRRVRLQYLLGDIETKTLAIIDDVAEADIVDFYENNKDQMFVQSESTASEVDAEDPAEQPGDEDNNEATEVSDANANESSESPETTESTETSGETGKTTPEVINEEQQSDTPPPDDEGAPVDSSTPADESQSGRRTQQSPFRLAVLQADDSATDSGGGDAGDGPQEETADEASNEDSANEEKPVHYVPLEEVRDLIKRQLARQKAVLQLNEDVDQATSVVQKEYRTYGPDLAEAQELGQEPPSPPENLADLASLAGAKGLAHEKTTLLSQSELAGTEVGKATQSYIGQDKDEQRPGEMVARAMFDDSRSLYEPFLAKDLGNNWFLVVKIEDKPARIPPLDEIRDDVVRVWKLRKAAQMALEEADKIKKEAETSGESLDILLASKPYETETTDMFSWLDFGTTPLEYLQYSPRRPQISDAPPLEAVGLDFMEKAFGLQADQLATVLNHNQSNAYLIRLAKRENTEDELRKQFLAEANSSTAGYIMVQLRFEESHQVLVNQLISRVNLNVDHLQEYFQPLADE